MEFLRRFRVDPRVNPMSPSLLAAYVEQQMEQGELVRWTVAVCGRRQADPNLGGGIDWGVPGGVINPVLRTRLVQGDSNSLGIITDPKDELIGLSEAQRAEVQRIAEESVPKIAENPASRRVRPPQEGLLLLYPISRHSAPAPDARTRRRLYDNPDDPNARDLIGLALSFPHTENAATIFGQGAFDYVTGTVDWRAVE